MLGRLEGKLCVHSRPKLDKWHGSSNKVKAAIFDSNENIDELERKALDLLVNICPNPHPWVVIRTIKLQIRRASSVGGSALVIQCGAHLRGAKRKVATPPHEKESVKVVWHLTWMPPWWLVGVTSEGRWNDLSEPGSVQSLFV